MLIRAVRIVASAPKKQKLASECPLGKLYDSGASKLKNGSGRGRLNVSLRVVFRTAAPSIVIPKSQASRRQFRDMNQINIAVLAAVRKRLDPVNEMPRIVAVSVGDAN